MKNKLSYSLAAQEDVLSIWDIVYAVSAFQETANQYIADMESTIRGILPFPQIGFSIYLNDRPTGFYSVNFKAYKIFYYIREDCVEVVRILPATADYMMQLFPEES